MAKHNWPEVDRSALTHEPPRYVHEDGEMTDEALVHEAYESGHRGALYTAAYEKGRRDGEKAASKMVRRGLKHDDAMGNC